MGSKAYEREHGQVVPRHEAHSKRCTSGKPGGRNRLNLLLGWGRLLSYGSLYPALKRLLRAGWITEVTAESPGVSRRQRIVYQITPAGRQYFGQEITDSGPAGPEATTPTAAPVLDPPVVDAGADVTTTT